MFDVLQGIRVWYKMLNDRIFNVGQNSWGMEF